MWNVIKTRLSTSTSSKPGCQLLDYLFKLFLHRVVPEIHENLNKAKWYYESLIISINIHCKIYKFWNLYQTSKKISSQILKISPVYCQKQNPWVLIIGINSCKNFLSSTVGSGSRLHDLDDASIMIDLTSSIEHGW